jgi:3',5'-cyclic AMP phosphodiesterase CpdA
MRVIAHISDLHFGHHDPRVAKGLLAALAVVKPDLVAISGDLTQRARRREFAAARAFIDSFGAPVIAVPGNHDVPLYDMVERLLRPHSRYALHISPEHQPLYVDDEIAVLGANTARGLAFKNGRLSARQIADIRATFAGLEPSVLKAVVTHHPLLPLPGGPELVPLHRAGRALDALAAAGVRLLLAGHHHMSSSADFHAETLGGRRSILIIQAGTAISNRRRRETNSFNRIEIDGQCVACTVHLWDSVRFAPAGTRRYALVAGHWTVVLDKGR